MRTLGRWGNWSLLGALFLFLACALAASAAPSGTPPEPLGALRLASEESPVITVSEATGVADFFSGAVRVAGASPSERARNFLKAHGAAFGVRDSLAELTVMREEAADSVGMSHISYEQVYRGVPVFGARLMVHVDRAGLVTAANGQFQPAITLASVTPALDGATAQAIALKDLGAAWIEWQKPPG